MRRVEQKEYPYTLSKSHKPVITIKPGETIVVETMDCCMNRIKSEKDFVLIDTIEEWIPLSGPIFIEGAEPGDTLTVYINDIKPLFGQGWGREEPGGISSAGHGDEIFGLYLINEPRPSTAYMCPIEDGVVTMPLKSGRKISVPTKPFIGTIGTAPEMGQAISAVFAGKYGGNMDSSDVCKGNKLFLPVNTEGALLHLGDAHALQGDGELAGAPIEIAAECTLTLDLIKNKTINWPRIESSEYIMTMGNSSPLDNSLRIANTGMIHLLRDEYGFRLEDAAFLSSVLFKIQVNQAYCPPSSVSVKFPKEYLPEKVKA